MSAASLMHTESIYEKSGCWLATISGAYVSGTQLLMAATTGKSSNSDAAMPGPNLNVTRPP